MLPHCEMRGEFRLKIMLSCMAKRNWVFIGIILFLTTFQVFVDLKIPDYMADVTTILQMGGDDLSPLYRAGGAMLACCLISIAVAVTVGLFSALVGAGYAKNLRSSLFQKVQELSMKELNAFSVPSLITRSTNDIALVQIALIMTLMVVVKAPITAIWAIGKILTKNIAWSVATGTAILIIVLCFSVLLSFNLPKFKKIQGYIDRLNRAARENLIGARVVTAYNAEGFQQERFVKENDILTKTNLFTARTMAVLHPIMTLLLNGLSLAIYWIGAYLIDAAQAAEKILLFSDMVVYFSYAMQIFSAFLMLIMAFVMLPRAIVSMGRIREVLNTDSSIVDGTQKASPDKNTILEFRDVSFQYASSGDYVIENISFIAHSGETVAIVGSTGCGKTTMVNLIPRFYDPTEGQVLINGTDIRSYTQASLLDKIGYIAQKAILFQGTIDSNIRYGEQFGQDIPYDKRELAAKVAQATEFIAQKEDGFESDVNQDGKNLSGGQKQRISIARALARTPDILIFDDSFSALDYATDRRLREELSTNLKSTIKIIVAQRIGTILNADQIIVLDEGKIAGHGTHKELLSSCEVYRQIARSQLSEEELAHDA